MNSSYRCLHQAPGIASYQALRQQAGLSPKSHEAAAKGLPNSLFAVQILQGDTPVGMGRVIGDGGCCFQVVDIAVLPAHQGQGLGKRIMAEIMNYLREAVPPTGYVSLIADGKAKELYAQCGFKETAPRSVGMALPVQKAVGAAEPATEA